MSQFRCVIQAASKADASRAELERRLDEHHERHYPGEPTSVTWIAVPEGRMFTEGRQSTSSIVSCFLEHETTLAEREPYMRAVCDIWTEVTECTDHEVVVTVTETIPATAGTTQE